MAGSSEDKDWAESEAMKRAKQLAKWAARNEALDAGHASVRPVGEEAGKDHSSCRRCGAIYERGDNFCRQCGVVLKAKYCERCGQVALR